MRKVLALLVVCLAVHAGPAVAQNLFGDDSQISILTIDSGDELYSAFGHTGIRVSIPESGIDIVYNYGTFDFDTPGFYLKFMRGQLDYRMSFNTFENVEYAYSVFEKRSIHEQVLDLSNEQKESIYHLLIENYRPENRYYRYDFFFDNCATRPRDILERAFNDSFRWDPETYTVQSFRQLLDETLSTRPWVSLGINLLLGLKTDKKASIRDAMFLPNYLMRGLQSATMKTDSTWQPAVSTTTTLFDASRQQASPTITPFWWFALVAALVLLISVFRPGESILRAIDVTIFGIFGLAGVLMALMWFASDHTATDNNLNLILWAWPTHVIAAFYIGRKQPGRIVQIYRWTAGTLALLVLVFWNWIPQQLPVPVIPVLVLFVARSFKEFVAIKPHTK